MIGLGSNRLTCCRRGGMSVTQAGRGGMEWLAGYREPSWASPYSRQATAALKAQFPTQWPTIRDYGFAHPALVPFINEDPMLVMSLIEGLGWRGLKNTTDAYIILDYVPKAATDIEASFIWEQDNPNTNNEVTLFGARASGNQFAYFVRARGKDYGYWFRGNANPTTALPSKNVIYNIHTEGAKLYIGTTAYTADANSQSVGYKLRLFDNNLSGQESRQYSLFRGQIGKYIIKESGSVIHELYPFKRNNVCGLIDVTIDKFYSNEAGSGSFTISETPAS